MSIRPKASERLTLKEAAAISGLSRDTLYTAWRLGRLRAALLPRVPGSPVRGGGTYLEVTRGDLHRYLVGRALGLRKPLPAGYLYPAGCFWPGVDSEQEGVS